MSPKRIALIPAYEPDHGLTTLLAQLHEKAFELIVVDDGSGPDYTALFQQASAYATVLTHEANQGKGQALKTGFTYIQETFSPESIIVTVDSDGQHRPEDAARLCDIVQQHPDTLVLGSRKLADNVPLRSQFGNTLTRLVYRLSTGLKVHDTQTGLRAFHASMLPELLAISGNRYEYEMNVLLEFARKRIPILETEIETIYIENNAGSHFDALRDSYRIYKEILKFSASSFIGFLVDYAMYSLLLLITKNLRISNIGARVVSASVNYTLNRKFVFKSKSGVAKSAFQYFLLAIIILCGNTLVLELLVNTCRIHKMLAKLLTEIIFFFLSWTVQRFLIFKHKA